MNIKEILEFIKQTLQNNVVAAVRAIKEHIYTVKLDSNKVEVTNPTIIPEVVDVKVTNPSDYKKDLQGISASVKENRVQLSKELLSELKNLAKTLKPLSKLEISNLKDIAPLGKITIANPQKTVSVNNLYEVAKEIGKVKKAIDSLKLDPKITVPDVIVPQIKIPEIKVPQAKVTIDLKKLEEILSVLSRDAKNPLAVRLSDGEKFYEAIFEAVSGGSSKSYAFTNSEGERGYALLDDENHAQVDIVSSPDVLEGYRVANMDDDDDIKYYGFVRPDSAWYILKRDTTAKTFRYANGTGSFTTHWTDRASKTYQLLYQLTWT